MLDVLPALTSSLFTILVAEIYYRTFRRGRPIETGDLDLPAQFKMEAALGFLQKGNKVRLTVSHPPWQRDAAIQAARNLANLVLPALAMVL